MQLEAYKDNELGFYLTTEGRVSYYEFEFVRFENLMTLLNLWGGIKPDVWGRQQLYFTDKFFVLSESLYAKLETFVSDLLIDPAEKTAKGLAKTMLQQLQTSRGKYFGYTRPLSPSIHLTLGGKHLLGYQVHYLNHGGSIDQAIEFYATKIAPWYDRYQRYTFGTTKFAAGRNDEERKCRFCGRTVAEGAQFRHVSHAVSQSSGNKLMSCNEECDRCNSRFGAGIELDFINYLEINRAEYKVRNQNGKLPVVIGENFCADRKGDIYVNEIVPDSHVGDTMKLTGGKVITLQALYRALVKFVIDLVPSEYMGEFEEPIMWINGKLSPSELPLVMTTTQGTPYSHPILDIFINRKHDPSVPYCWACLRCLDVIWTFVVPFCKSDHGRFKSGKALSSVIPAMQYVLALPSMMWEDYLPTNPRTVWKYVPVERLKVAKLQDVKAEIDHSTPSGKFREYVEFPPFDETNVRLESLNAHDYNQSLSYYDIPETERAQASIIHSITMIVHCSGYITVHVPMTCTTNRGRHAFDVTFDLDYKLAKPEASVLIDDSVVIDFALVKYLCKDIYGQIYSTLRDVYHQPFEPMRIEENLVSTIHNMNIFSENPAGLLHKITPTEMWNISYAHL